MNTPPTPTLDWAAIRSQCPTAFAHRVAWHYKSEPTQDTISQILSLSDDALQVTYEWLAEHPRDLYDWLDSMGVFVSVQWIGADSVYCRIEQEGKAAFVCRPQSTRSSAETAGFTAAFTVLEGMLSKQTKQEQV